MTIVINEDNPDKSAIDAKRPIPISFAIADVSASLSGSANQGLISLLQQAQLSNTGQRFVLSIEANEQNGEDRLTGVYYTPLYTEKIRYTEWQSRINKSFQELEVG